MISYRIYSALTDDPLPEEMNFRRNTKAQVSDSAGVHLRLDYEDPFFPLLPSLHKHQVAAPTSVSSVQKAIPVQVDKPGRQTVDWSKVIYLGLITNSSRGKELAILKIGESEYFVRESQQVDIFKVLRVSKDSITMETNEEVRSIKRKQ